MKHENNFDLLRLLAAAQVLFVHTSSWLKLPSGQPTTSFLYFLPGVPIFFIISGFLVIDSAMRSPTLLSFFWKRALRIYPALAVNLIGIEIMIYLSGQLLGIQTPFRYIVTMLSVIATGSLEIGFFFSRIPNMYTWFSGIPGGFLTTYPSGVLWTLTVELSFYLVVPAFAVVALRGWKAALALFAVVFVASATYASFWTPEVARNHSMLDVLCPQYLWIFAIGMVARVFWDRLEWLFEGKALFWVPLYFVINFEGFWNGWLPGGIDFHTGTNILTVARVVLLGCAILSVAFTFPRASSILKGNDISYGIYLWHMPVVVTLLSLGLTGHWWLWICVIGCTVLLASASWLLVERPALRLKNTRQKKTTDDLKLRSGAYSVPSN